MLHIVILLFLCVVRCLLIFRILSDMRTLSADWMANTSRPESELQSSNHGGEESKGNFFYPRPVAPTAAQVFPLIICQRSVSCFLCSIRFVCIEFVFALIVYSYAKV